MCTLQCASPCFLTVKLASSMLASPLFTSAWRKWQCTLWSPTSWLCLHRKRHSAHSNYKSSLSISILERNWIVSPPADDTVYKSARIRCVIDDVNPGCIIDLITPMIAHRVLKPSLTAYKVERVSFLTSGVETMTTICVWLSASIDYKRMP